MNEFKEPTFCLSIDLELLTGWHGLSNSIYERKVKEMRDVKARIIELIDMLDKDKIKCTWGIVSHLFLKNCNGHDDYPDMEWLAKDPKTDMDKDPLWYAPDLVKRLLESNFEIGCHSFSHPVFNRIREGRARYELKKSDELTKAFGVKLESFIFPGNEEGHKNILSEFGYKAYRSRGRVSHGSKVGKALGYFLATNAPGPQVPGIDEYGMVAIPQSMYLGMYAKGAVGVVCNFSPKNVLKEHLRKGLKKTVDEGGVFHVWMHPCEYGSIISREDFEYMIRLVKGYEARGELHVLTMSEVGKRVLNNGEGKCHK